MQYITRRTIYLLLSACITSLPTLSYATNGMFLIGYGANSRAMGGTAIAMSEDAIYTHSNPAAMGNLKIDAMRLDLDGTIFHPSRGAACCLAPDGIVSGSEWFFIPSMGMAYKFNRKISMGFSFVGAGGGNTRYNPNFFDAADEGSLGVNLLVAEMSPTVTYKVNKNQTFGVSPVIAIASFRAYGLGPFQRFSQDPDKVTGNGNDWAYGGGIRLGWQGKFLDKRLTLGGQYTSKRYMSNFDKYSGLFAGDGNLDLPENYGLGISIRPHEKWTVAFDWTRTLYSGVASLGNPSLPVVAGNPDSDNALGNINGPGFEWQDQDVYKLGIKYDWNDKWAFRVGANYGESPIPDYDGGAHEFNVLAPAVTEWHYTLGATYKPKKSFEFSFSYVYAPLNSQTAYVPPNTGLPFEDEDITLEMKQHSWSGTFSFLF